MNDFGRFFIHLIMFTLVSSTAFAQDREPLGSHWSAIIDALEKGGLVEIGDFKIREFRREAERIVWSPMSGAPASVLSGDRRTAYYIWKGGKVFINDRLPSEATASLAQLELHEALGATGYNDENYALSTALGTLAKIKDPAKRRELARAYGKTSFRQRLIRVAGGEGGGSAVTRGGDLISLFIKDQVLRLIMGDEQNSANATTDFLASYARITYEPLHSKRATDVVLRYELLFRPAANGEVERIQVLVPMERWNQGGDARQRLLREIAGKVMEIFPAYRGSRLTSFVPELCGSGTRKITFPATSDPAVRDIQQLRGANLRGCALRGEMPGMVSRSVTAPSLDRASEPKAAGSYYYTCELRYSSANLVYNSKVPAGTGMRLTHSWSIDPDDYLAGVVSITGTGEIQSIGILYHAPGAAFLPPVWGKVRNPTRAQAQISIHGRPLTYRCTKER